MRTEADGLTLEGSDVSVIVTKPGSCHISNFNVKTTIFTPPPYTHALHLSPAVSHLSMPRIALLEDLYQGQRAQRVCRCCGKIRGP